MTDGELLARYVAGGSEAAFAEIVSRHMDKVYSTCRRILGEAGRAQDAAQATFLVLARKARTLGVGTVLSGWLFLAARQSALALRQQEARRARHEREAGIMRRAESAAEAASWAEVRPRLDEAVAGLPARERDAVVLCYFGGKSQAEAAAELGCPQSTVSRRLAAALEQLRAALAGRGAALSAGALAGMLAERVIESAPAGLVGAVQAVCAGHLAASPLAAAVSKGVLKAMFWMKVKLAAAAVAAVTVAGGGSFLAVRALSAEPARLPAAAPAPNGGQAILDEQSCWRAFCTWKTPVVGTKGNLAEIKVVNFVCKSAPPPAGWPEPDFADDQWSRWRAMGAPDGFKENGSGDPGLAVQCLRGRFLVADPGAVTGLTLNLSFRGGAVVYVNGKEVTRGFLPKEGALSAETLADDYPSEVFLHAGPSERGSNCIFPGFGHPAKFKAQIEKRVRKIENVAIDSKLLRKGINILAVEVHRAPYQGPGMEMESLNHMSVWSTCGLTDLALTAAAGAAPDTARPAGVQVWAESPMQRSSPGDWADPLEPPGAVSIIGCRNGVFDGKVTVSSAEALRGVKAAMSDLVAKGGGKIPAASIKVLYPVRDDRNALRYRVANGFWDTLLETPPAEVQPVKVEKGPTLGAIQPMVIKVRVPAEAAPGDYQGKLTVNPGAGSPVEVPVRLKVIGWTLPDPKDFTIHLGIIESPESVAMWYKVPLWSEEHWKLLEKSFALLGEVGNKVVVLPMICRTNFGNAETLVRWVKDEKGTYQHDFTIFERYLDLALKHTKPDVVCLYVWDLYAGSPDKLWQWPGNQTVKVTLFDPKTGKAEEMEGPKYNSPEAKEFWAPIYKGVRERLEKRGLLPVTMLGLNPEATPIKEATDLFKEFFPGAKWVANPHGDVRGGNVGGIPIGYNTSVYINFFPPPGGARADKGAKDGRYHGWTYKSDIFPRSHGPALDQPLYHSSTLAQHRAELEGALLANCSGIGRTGADFWAVLAPPAAGKRTTGKRSETINGRFPETCWNQRNMNTATEALLAPGPDGAVSTERFENLREGAQLCEARIVIERAILDGKLSGDLAKKCQEILDERAWHLHAACQGQSWGWNWWAGASPGLDEKLFAAAAEAAARLGGK